MTCYSLDFRKKIIEAHKEGYSVRKIAQRFMISPSTVQKLITKYRTTGDLTPLKCGTKKPSVLSQHEELVLAMVKKYPDWTLRDNHGIIANTSMMFRFLDKHKITLKKTFRNAKVISEEVQEERLRYKRFQKKTSFL
jgi:transposase